MACVVQPGNPGGFQKVFFGREEVAIPVQGTVQEAVKAYPRADVFINFASFRRCSCHSSLTNGHYTVMRWRPPDLQRDWEADGLAQQCSPHGAKQPLISTWHMPPRL